jgi:hypothetical protein
MSILSMVGNMMAAMLDAEVEVGAGGADEAEAEAANLPRCQ